MQNHYAQQTIEISHEMLASSGKRFANLIVDLIVRTLLIFLVGGLSLLLYYLFEYDGLLLWMQEISTIQDILFGSFVLIMYYFTMEVFAQRTLGKLITGTKVVMGDGSKPEARAIIIRTLCRFIPFEPFSFLGDRTRGWHDTISDTYVVDIKKYEAALYLKNSFSEIGAEQL
jgi:uncharacterized RDD family membrane protein YckC